jgi:hypothetical protein
MGTQKNGAEFSAPLYFFKKLMIAFVKNSGLSEKQ